MPVEIRERFLVALQQRANTSSAKLTAVELAYAVGLAPDPWQQQVFESTARQIILLASRQSGKSTIAATLALHQCLYKANSLCLIVAPALRQSQETFRKCKDFLTQLDTQPAAESALRLEFYNRSRIVVIPATEKTRGYSAVDLLICDEAAITPDPIYMALRPTMAVSKGRIVLLSTPAGQRGFFHDEWTNGGDDWLRFFVPATECPRIDRTWLEAEKERIGSWWADQEYGCIFTDSSSQIFSTEDIMRMLSDEVQPLWV